MQHSWRGYHARQQATKSKNARKTAALIMQRSWRGYRAREKPKEATLEESKWQSRKPTYLSVSHGFLPSDKSYKSTKMLDGTISIVADKKREEKHFSKFHSVLQILLAAIYWNNRFIARPVAMTATTTLSSTHSSIFDLSESEFVFEYHRKHPDTVLQCLPMVEKGLLLQVGHTDQLVKQDTLLLRIHTFIKHYKDIICPSKRPLLSIKECFSGLTKFRLHFDCLYLLSNAEGKCMRNEGKVMEWDPKHGSAFDQLYDVWVCCYLPREQRYLLRYLPTASWDNHRNGHELQLSEFNEAIDTSAKLSKLSYWAMRAAKHYSFDGFDFIIPEYSLLYKEFIQNCIKA